MKITSEIKTNKFWGPSSLYRSHEKLPSGNNFYLLTLKAPITTAADDKFFDIFPNFRKK